MLTTRRVADELMARHGELAVELELSRRLLAHTPEARPLLAASERLGQVLAADQASELVAAGAAEASRLIAQARLEAEGREALRQARAEAECLLTRAAEQGAAAHQAAAARVAELHRLIDDLERRRRETTTFLAQVSGRIGRALAALDDEVPAAGAPIGAESALSPSCR